jgi:hypothetical protein
MTPVTAEPASEVFKVRKIEEIFPDRFESSRDVIPI